MYNLYKKKQRPKISHVPKREWYKSTHAVKIPIIDTSLVSFACSLSLPFIHYSYLRLAPVFINQTTTYMPDLKKTPKVYESLFIFQNE